MDNAAACLDLTSTMVDDVFYILAKCARCVHTPTVTRAHCLRHPSGSQCLERKGKIGQREGFPSPWVLDKNARCSIA
jgi:hypothetical protein